VFKERDPYHILNELFINGYRNKTVLFAYKTESQHFRTKAKTALFAYKTESQHFRTKAQHAVI
jgi:hypothetical protein